MQRTLTGFIVLAKANGKSVSIEAKSGTVSMTDVPISKLLNYVSTTKPHQSKYPYGNNKPSGSQYLTCFYDVILYARPHKSG